MKPPSADALIQCHPLPSWVIDVETQRVLAVNAAAVAAFGHAEADFLQQRLDELLAAEELPEPAAASAPAQAAAAAGAPGPTIWRLRHRNDTVGTFELKSAPLSFEGRTAWQQAAQDLGRQHRT